MKTREIEIKAKIKSAKHVVIALQDKFPEVIFDNKLQVDTVYVEDGINSLLDTWAGKRLCRIREENGALRFTIKTQKSNQLDREEVEFEVSNKDDIENVIFSLGFEKAMVISKQRASTCIKDINVCIDSVQGLGDFIELEILCDPESTVKDMQDYLDNVLSKWLPEESYEKTELAYDALIYKKNTNLDIS